jgi:hypothetical protein
MVTEVEVRLRSDGEERTVLELEHASPAEVVDELVRSYGPGGTIGIGCGWDLALLGLELYVRGAEGDVETWQDAPDVREFATQACHAWGAVVQRAWGTSDADIEAAIAFAVQHFDPH